MIGQVHHGKGLLSPMRLFPELVRRFAPRSLVFWWGGRRPGRSFPALVDLWKWKKKARDPGYDRSLLLPITSKGGRRPRRSRPKRWEKTDPKGWVALGPGFAASFRFAQPILLTLKSLEGTKTPSCAKAKGGFFFQRFLVRRMGAKQRLKEKERRSQWAIERMKSKSKTRRTKRKEKMNDIMRRFA